MAGLASLLQWQWRASWRRILRGGTAARSNLVVLGLMAAAGFARYITFLRGASGPTVELLAAGLLLLCIQPGWDASKLALGSRDMARFPLAPVTRISLRILSRFIAPVSWILGAVCIAGIWPVLKLAHPALAALTLMLLMSAAFALGVALVDFAGTARGARVMRVVWGALIVAAVVAWFAGVRKLPPLPSRLVINAGSGDWPSVAIAFASAVLGFALAVRVHPWMLRHSPPEQRSGQTSSARRVTLLLRELRLHASLTEVRTALLICLALCFYLATADRPEPDALRVMLGILAFLTIAAAMNSFGSDGVSGLDRFLLWPVQSARILANKNAAFAIAIGGPVVPLAGLAAWRFGWREGSADLLEAAAIVLATLAWGNITSVRHPESGESAAGGNLLDQLVGMAAIAIPTAASIGLLRGTGSAAPFYVLGGAAVSGAAYVASLGWSARYFARNYERMRQRLT